MNQNKQTNKQAKWTVSVWSHQEETKAKHK